MTNKILEQMVHVYQLASEMAKVGLSDKFITAMVGLASQYEGVYDLMVLWSEENDQGEKDHIIADIQELIDGNADKVERCEAGRIVKKPKLSFDKLDTVGSAVLAFKAELRKKVDKWGGISKLAEVTGMPQPSLSRFFSSASMPRRVTLYKIAEALSLPKEQIDFDWVT
jgi:DNA-binding phage protein